MTSPSHIPNTDALLARVETALNDWMRIHSSEFSPDMYSEKSILETRRRIALDGGVLNYATALLHDVREARKKMLRYREKNPLGGPAKVFEAMAGRIRAGEDYYDVLDDYGFMVKPDAPAPKP